MASIFVSYGRREQEAARALADDLTALGHVPWFDQALTGGHAWWSEILASIRRADHVAFVIGPASLESAACRRELGYAVELGKAILPVLVSDEVALELLPPALARIQFVDLRGGGREGIRALAKALNALPAPAPLPEPLPVEPEVPISYLGGIQEQVKTISMMSFADQSALVLRLKGNLDGPDRAHIIEMLRVLRGRNDLYARVADEIDSVLAVAQATARPAPATPVKSAPPPPPPEAGARPEPRSKVEAIPRDPGPAPEPPPRLHDFWRWTVPMLIASIVAAVGFAMSVGGPPEILHLGTFPALGTLAFLWQWHALRGNLPVRLALAIAAAVSASLVFGLTAGRSDDIGAVMLASLDVAVVALATAVRYPRKGRAAIVAPAIGGVVGIGSLNDSALAFEARRLVLLAWVGLALFLLVNGRRKPKAI